MNALLIYMIKVAVYLAGFYLVYRFLLSRDTMYGRNRSFILLSVISALILPFAAIETAKQINIPVFSRVLSDIFITDASNKSSSPILGLTGISGYQLLFLIYLTGVIFSGLKLIIDFAELFILIGHQKTRGSSIIKFHGLNTAGFSAFGHIFVSEKLTSEEADEIIRHEQNHLNHHHSADIVVMEIVRAFQWFNPFIHLFTRSLRAVHEYQADKECITTGISVNNYQKLLFNQVFKSKVFTITNSFSNPSLIKKRMIMMTKKRSRALANLKLLMVLPVIAVVMIFISSCNQNNKSTAIPTEVAPPPPPPPPPTPVAETGTDAPFVEVDELPVFKGGEAALMGYITKNTVYPEAAKTKGIQGKVVVRFAVEKDGSINKISVLKGVDPELDQEALRVVGSLPAFEKPGVKDGNNVAVWYMIPINFNLK
jgi:TonB family protein